MPVSEVLRLSLIELRRGLLGFASGCCGQDTDCAWLLLLMKRLPAQSKTKKIRPFVALFCFTFSFKFTPLAFFRQSSKEKLKIISFLFLATKEAVILSDKCKIKPGEEIGGFSFALR